MPSDLSIKQKILAIEPSRYWGDDFDVRFYLLTKIKNIKQSSILDVGGGIGIISSELDHSNFIVNIDLSFQDLKLCKKNNHSVEVVCSSVTHIPFRDMTFEYVVCSHVLDVLEVVKDEDMEKRQSTKCDSENITYLAVNKVISEIFKVLNKDGVMFFTTPNNLFYQTTKLEYNEVKMAISKSFSNYKLYFYNTFPRLHKKYRKMNLANILPKILSKIYTREKILHLLLKEDRGTSRYSISFYVEAIKN